jgi:hypothetical protein
MNGYVVNSISRLRGIFFSIALMVLLVSCMDEDEGIVSEPVQVAYVSLYHASPDAPDFDITVDGRVINRYPFEYSSSTGYMNFFTGERKFRFNAVNASNALIDTTFNLQENKAYSLFAINRLSDVEALLVVDSAGTPADGNAMVRFVHLSPDAPEVNISVNGTTAPLFANQSFKQSTEFREVPASLYSFSVTNASSGEVVLSADGVDLLPGRFYTIIVRGFAAPPQGNTNVLSIEVVD